MQVENGVQASPYPSGRSVMAVDWTKPIQFENGEPLELVEKLSNGKYRVFRPQESSVYCSVWDVPADGRCRISSISVRGGYHVVNVRDAS